MPYYPAVSSSSDASPYVPLEINSGETFTVPTNTQIPVPSHIIVKAGGLLYTAGSGQLIAQNQVR